MRPAQGQGACSDSESEPDHDHPHDEQGEDDNVIYTAKQQPGHAHAHGVAAFRSRILPRHSKGITTAPGQHGAGETETEADEPVRIRFFLSLFTVFSRSKFFF
jgi:hypothetical protein